MLNEKNLLNQPGNLCTHCYRVMYSETTPLQAGGMKTSEREMYGTYSLEDAQKTVNGFRELAAANKHFVGNVTALGGKINSAWIEHILRTRMDF